MNSRTDKSTATYKCGGCGAFFSSIDNLREHRPNCPGGADQNPDNEPGQHTCGICGKMFKTSTALGAHALTAHAGGRE